MGSSPARVAKVSLEDLSLLWLITNVQDKNPARWTGSTETDASIAGYRNARDWECQKMVCFCVFFVFILYWGIICTKKDNITRK